MQPSFFTKYEALSWSCLRRRPQRAEISCCFKALAVSSLVLASGCATASWLSAGSASSSSGGGFGLSVANKSSENLGWGFGMVFNSEMAGKDVNDYPVPHSDYSSLGTQRTGNTLGLDAYWFPTGDSQWRPYTGLGLYYDRRAEIAQSNVTGWYYTQKDRSALRAGVEVGIQRVSSGGVLFGLGYHSIRGAFISLGW